MKAKYQSPENITAYPCSWCGELIGNDKNMSKIGWEIDGKKYCRTCGGAIWVGRTNPSHK